MPAEPGSFAWRFHLWLQNKRQTRSVLVQFHLSRAGTQEWVASPRKKGFARQEKGAARKSHLARDEQNGETAGPSSWTLLSLESIPFRPRSRLWPNISIANTSSRFARPT